MNKRIRIGIDFDNTLICYEKLFIRALEEKKWELGKDCNSSKSSIKERLIELDGNDYRWQELQAIVYGILIKDADMFPGVSETLKYLKQQDCELFVVSHKTPTSLYLKHITLIDKAQLWIESRALNDYIPKENIFFCPTRDEKIRIIKNLNLDFFIDDLLEVLNDKNFPPIKSFFFSPDGSEINHWKKILNNFEIISCIGLSNFEKIQEIAPFPYDNYEFIKREGNNQVIRFECQNQKKIVLKKYSKLNNSYATLDKEFAALQMMKDAGLPVPMALFKDSIQGVGLYENIETLKDRPQKSDIVRDFSNFLASLYHLSQKSQLDEQFTARDSRDKVCDYKNHIERRLTQISAGCKADKRFNAIKEYIDSEFKPLYSLVLKKYQGHLGKFKIDENRPLTKNQKILSPSDFGMHNAIYNDKGHFTFIDFEYFGWDDPVKLIADFLHHAGQENISIEERFDVLINFSTQTSLNKYFFMRLSCVLDLIGLEWILIILNIANPEVLQRRMHSNPDLDLNQLLEQRLKMACERADLFHTNIKSNSVFLSLKSIDSKIREIPIWQQLITSS